MNNFNLKIEYLGLDKIKPYEKNPRKNDNAVKPLMESIKQFGFSFPITIDADGVIISGHTRYKAAKKLKLKTVPCVRREDLTPEQEAALRLVDNQIASISEWDFPLREEEFAKVGDIDLSCLGFDTSADAYIDSLLTNDFAPQNKDTQEFEMTLLFPKTHKAAMDNFISEHGKQAIVDNVLSLILSGGGGGYIRCLTVGANVTSATFLFGLIITSVALTLASIALSNVRTQYRTYKTGKA